MQGTKAAQTYVGAAEFVGLRDLLDAHQKRQGRHFDAMRRLCRSAHCALLCAAPPQRGALAITCELHHSYKSAAYCCCTHCNLRFQRIYRDAFCAHTHLSPSRLPQVWHHGIGVRRSRADVRSMSQNLMHLKWLIAMARGENCSAVLLRARTQAVVPHAGIPRNGQGAGQHHPFEARK